MDTTTATGATMGTMPTAPAGYSLTVNGWLLEVYKVRGRHNVVLVGTVQHDGHQYVAQVEGARLFDTAKSTAQAAVDYIVKVTK